MSNLLTIFKYIFIPFTFLIQMGDENLETYQGIQVLDTFFTAFQNVSGLAKELSLCHKLCFSKSYIFIFQCRRPQIFQTMNSVRSNNISLKYQRFTTLGSKDIGIINSEFVAKTQFQILNLFLYVYSIHVLNPLKIRILSL